MNKKKFISSAKDVINLEIRALQKLKKIINNSFNEAVIQIAKCQSKIILCGVGKSGLIASKISATLASVGTPSFSLSASEASHGGDSHHGDHTDDSHHHEHLTDGIPTAVSLRRLIAQDPSPWYQNKAIFRPTPPALNR